MWVQYTNYDPRIPALWEKLLTDIKCSHVASEPLIMEIVTEILFEKWIEAMFTAEPEESTEVITIH